MREILFRGKAGPTWVIGSLLAWPDGQMEICTQTTGEETQMDKLTVNPETVGQFTGLTDKNGTKVFEGDILKIAKRCDSTGAYYHPPLDYPVNVVAKWDLCAWMWETLCDDKRYIGFPDAWCQYVCEVIGNIHDNPELLEGSKWQ